MSVHLILESDPKIHIGIPMTIPLDEPIEINIGGGGLIYHSIMCEMCLVKIPGLKSSHVVSNDHYDIPEIIVDRGRGMCYQREALCYWMNIENVSLSL